MRRLLLLRHAKAERLQPGGRDHDRVLAARGRADMKTLGAYLARHSFIPDRAVVSASAMGRAATTLAISANARAHRSHCARCCSALSSCAAPSRPRASSIRVFSSRHATTTHSECRIASGGGAK